MWGVINGIVTVVAMITFIGIVWWAWSKHRVDDNNRAAQLPFDLPDEVESSTNQNKGVNQ